MEQKKVPFFRKLKNAITNFDEYQKFSKETLGTTIKYFLKFMLIFSILISAFFTARLYREVNELNNFLQSDCPNFKIENNTLIIEGETKQYEKNFEQEYVGVIVDADNTELKEEQNNKYLRTIAFLKDKMIVDAQGTKNVMTYEEIAKSQNINGLSKQSVLDYINSNSMITMYALFFVITLVLAFVIYTIQILIIGVIPLSIIGFITSRLIGINLKYKEIFNMSIYALTLSNILYVAYICANIMTGFTIKYFELAYNVISYIYIITAILMIKSDLIKQQIEVGRIIEEQKKVRQEKQEENKEDNKEKEPEEQKPKEEKKKKQDKKENNEENPEGSQA